MGAEERAIDIMRDISGYMEPGEIDRILSKAKSNPRDHLFILLLWNTGARVSELLQLSLGDVDFARKALILPTLKRRKKKGRFVDLPAEIMDELASYITKVPMEPSDKFFRFKRKNAFYIVRKYGDMAGIKRVGHTRLHPHHFRHSHAIALVKAGVPLPMIQARLGHASLASTSFYLQFRPDETRTAMERYWNRPKEPKKRTRKTPEESVAKVLGSLTP